MPIRQPCSGDSPASSACSSNGFPELAHSRPLRRNRTRPSAAAVSKVSGGGVNSSVCTRSPNSSRTASISGFGPQTNVSASRNRGSTCSAEKNPVRSPPFAWVYAWTTRSPGCRAASSASSVRYSASAGPFE